MSAGCRKIEITVAVGTGEIGPKLGLGGSWAPFGKGLGRSGLSFERSWALWALFLALKTELL